MAMFKLLYKHYYETAYGLFTYLLNTTYCELKKGATWIYMYAFNIHDKRAKTNIRLT